MKKILFIGLLTSVLFPCSLLAQDWTVQENNEGGKPSQNVYMTNKWRDNLFIGATAGVSTRFTVGSKSDITSTYANPDINVFILKWFVPQIGLRIGYQGFNGREGLDRYAPQHLPHSPFGYKVDRTGEFVDYAYEPGVLYYGMMHLHGDVMWNINNTFEGYKRDRFFEISAYFSGGYLRVWDNKLGLKGSSYDQEFALGLGAYATFRFTHRLVGVADLRFTNHASRYRTTSGVRTTIAALSIGVAYNLCKNYWSNANSVAMTVNQSHEAEAEAREMLAKAEDTNVQLEKEVENLHTQIDDMNKAIEVEASMFKERVKDAEMILYFSINETTLNYMETQQLKNYVERILSIEPDHVFKVTGSADKGTGTEKRNEQISMSRANYVKSILINDFGVKPENIVLSSIVTDKNADEALDRCVLLER